MPRRVWPARAACRAAGGRTGRAPALGAIALGLAAGAPPRPLLAQAALGSRFDAEAGAAVVRQPGVAALIAPTLGAAWTWDGARTAVRADGVVAAGASAWAGQIAASAAQFVGDVDGPVELGLRARFVHAPATPATVQLLGNARRHLTFGEPLRTVGGVWAGGLGGVTTGAAAGAAPVYGLDAGAWRALPGATRLVAAAVWTATRADSAALFAAAAARPSFGALVPVSSRVRTLDLTAAIERLGGRVELTGSVGARHTALGADPGAVPGGGWGALAIGAVTWWLRPGVALVAGAGAQPADPARGLPAVRHVALTLRLRPRAWTAAPPGGLPGAPRPGRGASVSALSESTVRVAVTSDGERVLHVAAPGAGRVQLRGAATGWRPVDLARTADGDWVVALAWPAGAHHVAIRIDDGVWRVPANVPAVDDGFGGQVGLVVVP
ncbi:hypothetical protein tb265_24520 [Gemmatimonadetes bacterium T265]|nr:hypothetical protein tb265_24520 [Gemmatimonadetes bacterium T265]